MIKKVTLFFLMTIIVISTIVGCSSLSLEERREQQARKSEFEKIGEEYMEQSLKQKYGKELDVYGIRVHTYSNQLFGGSSGIYKPFVSGKVKCDGKIYQVCASIDDDKTCYDNIQYSDIVDDLKDWIQDIVKAKPYYIKIDACLSVEGFGPEDGMNKIFYNGNIESFIEDGLVDGVVAFYNNAELNSLSTEDVAHLSKIYETILIDTHTKWFGQKEAEDIDNNYGYNLYIPYIDNSWICKDGKFEYLDIGLVDCGDFLYYGPETDMSNIVKLDSEVPLDCVTQLQEKKDVKRITRWLQPPENSVIYFKTNKIHGYADGKNYCQINGINKEASYNVFTDTIRKQYGDYLMIETGYGLDRLFALGEYVK